MGWIIQRRDQPPSYGRNVSDHSPLLFKSKKISGGGPFPFKFQRAWIKAGGFIDLIKNSWSLAYYANGMTKFLMKLKSLKHMLKTWKRETFGNVFSKFAHLRDELIFWENKLDSSYDTYIVTKYNMILAKYNDTILQEELFLKQKSES